MSGGLLILDSHGKPSVFLLYSTHTLHISAASQETSFLMSVGSFMFLPNLSTLPTILLSPSFVRAGNDGTEAVEPGFNRSLETIPIPWSSGSYWFKLGSVVNRISSTLYPDTLWVPCMPPHTPAQKQTSHNALLLHPVPWYFLFYLF